MSLAGSGVSIGGVRSLRVEPILECFSSLCYAKKTLGSGSSSGFKYFWLELRSLGK